MANAYKIGDKGPAGGTVFITPETIGNGTGLYFEAAPSGWYGTADDPSLPFQDTAYQNTSVSTVKWDIGFGKTQTDAIIAQNNTGSFAAKACKSYTLNGYSDWFLGSVYEVVELLKYVNQLSLTLSSTANNSNSYRYATVNTPSNFEQYSINSSGTADYSLATTFSVGLKSTPCYVRPIRSFTAKNTEDKSSSKVIVSYRNTTQKYSIGSRGPGGGIVFITPSTSGNTTGQYFESLPIRWNNDSYWTQSQSHYYDAFGLYWSPNPTVAGGGVGTAIGTGKNNQATNAGSLVSGTQGSAIQYGLALTYNGYSDWFLPSLNELLELYTQRSIVGGLPASPSVSTRYWASTEATATTAYYVDFSNGTSGTQVKTNQSTCIRLIRSFYDNSSEGSVTQRIGNDQIYGNGADGNVIISSNTTLTSDMYYNNLTVNNGVILNTNGFRVFVKGTLTLNGYIGVGTSSGTETLSTISDGTVAGTNSSTSITYSLGAPGGGATQATATRLPASYRRRIEDMLQGAIIDQPGVSYKITGGSAGTTGATGTPTPALTNADSWPGKAGTTNAGAAGATGSYAPNATSINAPGGKGNTGYPSTATAGTVTGATPGPGGSGGSGGAGGAVVLISARRIAGGGGTVISRGMSGGAGGAGTAGSVGTAGSASAGGAATAYTGTTQRGTSGTDLVDGHQAPTLHHHATSPTTSHTPHHHTNPHHTSFSPAHTHHYYVLRNLHSHSNNVNPNTSRTHYGHHHGNHDLNHGSNTHYYHIGNKHATWTHATSYYATGHDAAGYAHRKDDGYGGYLYGGRNEPAWGLGYTHHAGLWHHNPHINGGHHTVAGAVQYHTPHHTVTYPGGTGGAGGTAGTAGAAAPAVTGATGGNGGAGGGGGIVIITEEPPTNVTYDTAPGQTAGSGSFTPQYGYTYILLNA